LEYRKFDFSYSYTNSQHHSPLAVEDELITYKGGLGYNFAGMPKYWEPFKKFIKSKSTWYRLLKDFNLNPVPSVITFRADIVRQFGAYRSRNIGGPKDALPETFNKFFTFDRTYVLRWDLTRSLNIDYSALNKGWVDEDSGRLNKAERRQIGIMYLRGEKYQLFPNGQYTYSLLLTNCQSLTGRRFGRLMDHPISGLRLHYWPLRWVTISKTHKEGVDC